MPTREYIYIYTHVYIISRVTCPFASMHDILPTFGSSTQGTVVFHQETYQVTPRSCKTKDRTGTQICSLVSKATLASQTETRNGIHRSPSHQIVFLWNINLEPVQLNREHTKDAEFTASHGLKCLMSNWESTCEVARSQKDRIAFEPPCFQVLRVAKFVLGVSNSLVYFMHNFAQQFPAKISRLAPDGHPKLENPECANAWMASQEASKNVHSLWIRI